MLPRFAVAGLPAEASGTRGTSSPAGRSDGWAYQDADGRTLQVDVASSSVTSVSEEQQWAVFNILFPFARAVHGNDVGAYESEVEAVTNAIRSGSLVWEERSLLLDGEVTAVEVLEIRHDFWIAVGHVSDCVVTVSSHGVPRDGLELTRVPSPTPRGQDE